MSKLSVSTILRTAITILVAGMLATLSMGAWSTWNRLAVARKIVSVTDVSSNLFKSLQNLRLDRNNTYRDVMSDKPPVGVTAATRQMRDAGTPPFARAIEGMKTFDFPDKARVLKEAEAAYARLISLQEETAAAMSKPKAERRAGLGAEWLSETTRIIEMLGDISASFSRQVKLADATIDKLLDVKETAWAARNSAGDATSMVSNGTSGIAMAPDALNKHLMAIGATLASITSMREAVAGMEISSGLRDALDKVEAEYVKGPFLDGQSRQIQALLAGQKPPMSSEQWAAFILTRLASIAGVADAALDMAQDHAAQVVQDARTGLLVQIALLIAAIAIAGGTMFIISRRVTGPLATLTQRMTDLADGRLDTEVPFTGRGDEIGGLGRTMATFKVNMAEAERLRGERAEQERMAGVRRREEMQALADRFDRAVGGIVGMVASAATELQASAQTLTGAAEQTSHQATSVAAASEEASTNVASVASATEELSSSVREISRQVDQSADIASRAVTEASLTNERVRGLATAADKIGSIVGLINEIAGKTNLLALNATIEAARAGEAGRGFAVVAAEVKQLADQTAKATAEISTQVGAIQEATADAAHAIDEIGSTIETMNTIAGSIAQAVEGQGAATAEIASNVQEASRGTAMVSDNITRVTVAATDSSEAASEVFRAASELSSQAEILRGEVAKFLETVRAA